MKPKAPSPGAQVLPAEGLGLRPLARRHGEAGPRGRGAHPVTVHAPGSVGL